MISFSGNHISKHIMLYAVFFYLRYAVSYRDLEEIMKKHGVTVDNATLNRWVIKYSPLIAIEALRRKARTNSSCRMALLAAWAVREIAETIVSQRASSVT